MIRGKLQLLVLGRPKLQMPPGQHTAAVYVPHIIIIVPFIWLLEPHYEGYCFTELSDSFFKD